MIGTGGKVIREIVEKTGAKVNIDDDGTVKVASADGESIKAAIKWIKSIASDPELGQIYDGTVVKVPGSPEDYSDEQLASLLTVSDVMSTGYHAAVSAEVKPGDTAVVMGDGAVGLCGVIAAKMRGATRVIAMSRHEDRAALARLRGAGPRI